MTGSHNGSSMYLYGSSWEDNSSVLCALHSLRHVRPMVVPEFSSQSESQEGAEKVCNSPGLILWIAFPPAQGTWGPERGMREGARTMRRGAEAAAWKDVERRAHWFRILHFSFGWQLISRWHPHQDDPDVFICPACCD